MLSRDGTCSFSKYPEHTEESLYEQRVHAGGRTKKLPSLHEWQQNSKTTQAEKCTYEEALQESQKKVIVEQRARDETSRACQHPNKTLPMMGARG